MAKQRVSKIKRCLLSLAILALFAASAASLVAQTSNETPEDRAFRIYDEGRRLARSGKTSESRSDDQIASDLRAAIDRFSTAREIFKQIGNRKSEAHCLTDIANIYSRLLDHPKAIDLHQQAVAIFRELRDRNEEAIALGHLATTYRAAVHYSKAIETYLAAFEIGREVGDKYTQAQALDEIGRTHLTSNDLPRALDYFLRALPLYNGPDKKIFEAETMTRIGGTYRLLGELGKAMDWYAKALDSFRSSNSKYGEVKVLGLMGSLNSSLGEKQKALSYYNDALALAVELKDLEAAANVRLDIADIYAEHGDGARAAAVLKDLLATFRTLQRKSAIIDTLLKLSEIARKDAKSGNEALAYLNEALEIAKAMGDKRRQASVVLDIGIVHASVLNDHQTAIKYKSEALKLYDSLGEMSAIGSALHQIGTSHWAEDRSDIAFGYFSMAYAFILATGDLQAQAFIEQWQQNAWAYLDHPNLSILYGKLAVNTHQRRRAKANTLDRESQKNYLKTFELLYRRLADQLLRQDRLPEAIEVLASFKDQQFYDGADRSRVEEILLEFTPEEKEFVDRAETLSRSLAETYMTYDAFRKSYAGRNPTPAEEKKLAEYSAAVKASQTAFTEFFVRARNKLASVTKPEHTRRSFELQKIVRTLADRFPDDRTVVVHQYAGNMAYHSLIITAKTIRLVSTPSVFETTSALARRYWALLQSDRYDPRPVGKELYDIVFKPIEKELPAGTKTILWSLDGNLRYVPMSALYDGRRYLVERFNHVTFTRADGDRLTREVSPKWNAAAFGNSKAQTIENRGDRISFAPLSGVVDELNNLFSRKGGPLIGAEVLLDGSFTRRAMLDRLREKRPVVHIASHFSFRPGDETRSFLLLGDGTAFTLADMKMQNDMFAGVELLTLSACNTAAQQPDANGREVDAFFELAQRLGAQSVLATLWPVADNSTPWLMREFYALKIGRKQNKGEALRNAQLALLNGSARASRSRTRSDASPVKIVVADDPRKVTDTRGELFVIENKHAKPFRADPKRPFAHPFYWSPFVLIGNWR